jgi:hypothetical protein
MVVESSSVVTPLTVVVESSSVVTPLTVVVEPSSVVTPLTVAIAVTLKKDINHIFYPKQKDPLFWSFYIMVHGDLAYELIQPINLVSEKKIKIEYIEKIRLNKALLKQHKYATLSHIENQLLNEQRIDIKTFFSLCVLEKMNVFFFLEFHGFRGSDLRSDLDLKCLLV